ncbi:hypothetical protein [Haloarcula sp. CGMCC 1.2071]|uniref:hypothetical protein n=1 Tax=Haloarcula sp. CGMCC 1.2071 TaxID=3111454 RepID=UPI00300F6292
MRRRQFLASGIALPPVALAGCAHPAVSLDMRAASADDIASEVSMIAQPDSGAYGVMAAAVENGTATRQGYDPLLDGSDTVRFNNSFYRVSETMLGTSEVTVYEVSLDFNPTEAAPEFGEIQYENLPKSDREHFDYFFADENPPADGEDSIDIEYGPVSEVSDDSVFVPDPQYDVLIHDGNRYQIDVSSHSRSQTKYQYEVTKIAPDSDILADRIREQYLFTLTDLTDAERKVVEEAIDSAYYERDEAFQSVIDRIREHEGLNVGEGYGTWLIEYESAEYITHAEWVD